MDVLNGINIVSIIFFFLFVLSSAVAVKLAFIAKDQKEQLEYLESQNGNLAEALAIDDLTKLFTRKAFTEKFEKRVKLFRKREDDIRQQFMSGGIEVLFIDIDHFKDVNDTYGHAFGDEVLREVSRTIKETLRETDLVGRWGGEEIVVMLSMVDETQVGLIASKLNQAIADLVFSNEDFSVTISVGVAYTLYQESLDSLIERADVAMYEAKEGGRNRVCISTNNE
ncbi:MAG: hypothetical protein RLZZ230_743 [Candidatus Parcubacteria bacterium]|jgi:diguanylate cyclase (GGDEF)-like protein